MSKNASNNKDIKTAGKIMGSALLLNKITLSGIILVILAVVLITYITGIFNTSGKAPYSLCGGNSGVGSSNEENTIKVTTVKDGFKMPVDYNKTKSEVEDFNGKNYTGNDSQRGIGKFWSEDFGGNEKYSKENYEIDGRWEYFKFESNNNKISKIFDIDANQLNWTRNQKVLINNPKNGKSVIATITSKNGGNALTNGRKDLNKGPIGLSYKIQKDLGFSIPGESGELGNLENTDTELKAFFLLNTNEEVGLTSKKFLEGYQEIFNHCSGSSGAIGNSSIAEAAASLADPNYYKLMTTIGKAAGHFLGTPNYIKVCELTDVGRPDNCIGAVQAIIKLVGADINFPRRDPDWYITNSYFLQHPDIWEEVPFNGDESVLQPGDVFMSHYFGKFSHTFIYTGSEIMQKYHPELGEEYKYAEASYSSYGLIARTKPHNLNIYRVYRSINKNPSDEYKSKTNVLSIGN